jgi:type I restriction enzyme, S subunit
MENGKLPDGWDWTTFGDVVVKMSNGTTQQQNKDGDGFPVSRIETISQGVINLNRVGYIRDVSHDLIEKYQLQHGDILFSHINSDLHLGKTAIFENTGVPLLHGMNLLRLQVNRQIVTPRFFHYVCNHLRYTGYFISVAQHAVNQSSINQKKLSIVPFPLPSISEQEKIVAKIEELFTQLEAGTSALEKVQAGLRRYKASVLKAAVEGKLGSQNDEGGMEEGGLPDGWRWVTLEEVSLDANYGTSQKCDYVPTKYPVVRIPNIVSGSIDLSDLKYAINGSGLREKDSLQSGDLLIVRTNGSKDLIGKSAMVRIEPSSPLYFASYLTVVSPKR